MSVSVIVLGWLGEIPYGSFFQNRPRFYWRCCPNWVLLSFLLCSAIMAWFIWLVSDYGFATWLKHCTRFINLNFRRKYQDVMGWPWCFIISLAFRRHGLCASVGFTFSTYERYLITLFWQFSSLTAMKRWHGQVWIEVDVSCLFSNWI